VERGWTACPTDPDSRANTDNSARIRFGAIWCLLTVMSVILFLVSFDGGISPTAGRYFAVYAGADDRRNATRLLVTLVLLILLLSSVVSVSMFFLAPLIVPLFHMPDHLRASAVFPFV